MRHGAGTVDDGLHWCCDDLRTVRRASARSCYKKAAPTKWTRLSSRQWLPSGLGRRRGCRSRHQRAGRAAGGAWRRMRARCLSGLGCWGRVGKGAGIGATRTHRSGWLGRWCRVAVVGGHAILRQTQLVVAHLASPGGLGGCFGSLGSCLWRRCRQLGRCQRANTGCAQRQQRGTGKMRHGAKPHTCAGRPADGVAAASAAGWLALRCRGILPAWTSSYQSSWCSRAQPSLT